MKSIRLVLLCLGLGGFFLASPAHGYTQRVWTIVSPDHGQTFTFGSEQNRAWANRGGHLAVFLNYTNDPYVDRSDPRQYDNFTFNFPDVRLGADDRTFFYHTPAGAALAVATRESGFLGVDEIKLLPNSYLSIRKPHGFLTVTLMVQNHSFASNLDQ